MATYEWNFSWTSLKTSTQSHAQLNNTLSVKNKALTVDRAYISDYEKIKLPSLSLSLYLWLWENKITFPFTYFQLAKQWPLFKINLQPPSIGNNRGFFFSFFNNLTNPTNQTNLTNPTNQTNLTNPTNQTNQTNRTNLSNFYGEFSSPFTYFQLAKQWPLFKINLQPPSIGNNRGLFYQLF